MPTNTTALEALKKALTRIKAAGDPALLKGDDHDAFMKDCGTVQSWCNADGLRQLLDIIESSAPSAAEPVIINAVAEVASHADGPILKWYLEGGIHELPEGVVLLVADQAITDDCGHGEVHLAPPAPAPSAASEREALTDSAVDAIIRLVEEDVGHQSYAWDLASDRAIVRAVLAAWIGWQARADLHSTGKPDGEVAPQQCARLTDAARARMAMQALQRISDLHSQHRACHMAQQALDSIAAAAPADAPVAEPVHGWVTMWPKPGGGRAEVYSHGEKKPSYGTELDALLNVYPVYARSPSPENVKDAASEPLTDDEIDRLAWAWGVREKRHNPASGDVDYRWDFSESRLRSFVRAALSQGAGA